MSIGQQAKARKHMAGEEFKIDPITDLLAVEVGELIGQLMNRIDALEARPTLKFIGVWHKGVSYQEANAVSHDGSVWIALRATDAKPGEPGSGWQLAVKKGANGRDGRDGKDAAEPRIKTALVRDQHA